MKKEQEVKKFKFNDIVRRCDCEVGNLRYSFIGYADGRGIQEYVNCDWFLCEHHWKTDTPIHQVLEKVE